MSDEGPRTHTGKSALHLVSYATDVLERASDDCVVQFDLVTARQYGVTFDPENEAMGSYFRCVEREFAFDLLAPWPRLVRFLGATQPADTVRFLVMLCTQVDVFDLKRENRKQWAVECVPLN